jgi:hypothetical protein
LIVTKTPTDVVQASSIVATVTEAQAKSGIAQNIQCALSNVACHNLFPFLQRFYGPLTTFDVVSESEVAPGYRAVILRGTGPSTSDHKSGDFMKAESFGVFIVDSAGNHVLTLDIFPTGRMLDYDVKLGEHGDGYLTILGSGSTYGDEPMKRKYFYDIISRKVFSAFTGGINANFKYIIEFNGSIYCIGNTDKKTAVVAKIKFPQPTNKEIETISTIQNERIETILDAKKYVDSLVLTSETNQYVLTKNTWERTKNPAPRKYQYQTEGFAGLPEIHFWVPSYRVQKQAVDVELDGEMHTFLVWNNEISANGGGPNESGIYDIQGKSVKFYPLPQPSYGLFRQFRPTRVEDGYSENETTLETEIGAFQLDGGQIMFGLGFYDGEGTTGVGGIGSFDLKSKKFEVAYLKEIAASSVYSILVEPNSIWLGLGGQPEGAVYSKGMAKVIRKSNSMVLYKEPNLVNTIVRVGRAIYAGTSDGVVIYGDDGSIENIKLSINKDGGYSTVISNKADITHVK